MTATRNAPLTDVEVSILTQYARGDDAEQIRLTLNRPRLEVMEVLSNRASYDRTTARRLVHDLKQKSLVAAAKAVRPAATVAEPPAAQQLPAPEVPAPAEPTQRSAEELLAAAAALPHTKLQRAAERIRIQLAELAEVVGAVEAKQREDEERKERERQLLERARRLRAELDEVSTQLRGINAPPAATSRPPTVDVRAARKWALKNETSKARHRSTSSSRPRSCSNGSRPPNPMRPMSAFLRR